MYCINCGVKLADSEKKCPLCNTVVYHPDLMCGNTEPLYPQDKIPKTKPPSKAFNGVIIITFFIPILISIVSDWQTHQSLSWSVIVTGALILSYILFGLPFWFRKPNPVIFIPCDFVAITLYLLFINVYTNGN